ncbi:MAG: methyltransferase domain-containing protein [Thermoanaerobaculia bacterium]|nr:methyltransferase domain-containing protein [Thermoanaerobaculia bacterium]
MQTSSAVRWFVLWTFLLAPAMVAQDMVAENPAEHDKYVEFLRWLEVQADEVRSRAIDAYRGHLESQGLGDQEIAERVEEIQQRRQRQGVERWNRFLTEPEPRFNTGPNDFLVRTIEGRPPGTALDVGMGQGRNSIWLAQQGWEVVGFDPADRAVALARTLAEEAGVEIRTEVVGSEDFDWGTDRWDLVVFSYVDVRPWIEVATASLRSGGLVVLEAFHHDATREGRVGPAVVWQTNEVLKAFLDFRILLYEDAVAEADFGRGQTRVVRLLAEKE